MAEDFIFEDSPEFVWVDTPDNTFADSTGVSNIIRLAYPVAYNISVIYKAYNIRGGKVQKNSTATIRIGHGSSIIVQLRAEQVDTGEEVILTALQMASIERVALCLEAGKVIDSDDAVIGLGADQEFDHEIDTAAAKMVVTVGGTTAIAAMAGEYEYPHLDIYFAGKTLPVAFAFPPVLVLPGD